MERRKLKTLRGKRRTRITVASAFLVGAVALLYGQRAVADGRWGADYFPNVPLTTQDGATVHFYDDLLKGKSVAINLIYTSCKAACPLETAKLARVQRLLGDRVGKDIFFYSISIDPEHDTPAVLKAYAEKFHVGPGWLFLTGKAEDIQLVGKKLGLTSVTDATNPDGHRPSLMIGNVPTQQWMRNSAVDDPGFLAITIRNFVDAGKPHEGMKSYAEVPAIPPLNAGEYLFGTMCASCHTIGKGDAVGPDLLGVTTRRERDWLTRYVMTPDKLLADKDPIAVALFEKYKSVVRMPNLRLGPGDVAAVLSYIEKQSGAAQQPGDSVSGR